MLRRPSVVVFVLSLCLAFPAAAQEANQNDSPNAGQATLDRAIEAKLAAESLEDLGKVIDLCEQAIAEGLDEANTEFAKQLANAARLQRGTTIAEAIVRPTLLGPPKSWQMLRKQALEDLEAALDWDDNQPQAWILVGQLNMMPGGDKKSALKALDKAVEKAGENRNLLAQAYLLRTELVEKPAEKIETLGKAIELLPDNPVPLRLRGLLYAQQEQYEKALNDFAKALELDPTHAGTVVAEIDCLVELKRFDRAMKLTKTLEELLPEQSLPWFQKGRIAALQEQFEKAIEYLTKALELDSRDVRALLLRAAVYNELNETEKALADLDKAIRLQPDNPQLIRMRASMLAGTGKFKEAIADLERIEKAQPQDVQSALQLGLLYAAERYHAKAVEKFTEVLKLEPDNLIALRGRADAYLSMGKQAEAIADYERALKVAPDDDGVLNNLAWLLCTSPDPKLRDGKRALELAKKACELTDYQQAHILSTLAAAYAELGDFESAKKWSAKAVELGDPEEKEALQKELESYKRGEPVRELIQEPPEPPADSSDTPNESTNETQSAPQLEE
ncbi:MAG: tetratricopeptide repeat protein [Planctomycetota bacterium]|nr:MAG: tetratricopeptide repeat protein [Planctomycetota bacterium]